MRHGALTVTVIVVGRKGGGGGPCSGFVAIPQMKDDIRYALRSCRNG